MLDAALFRRTCDGAVSDDGAVALWLHSRGWAPSSMIRRLAAVKWYCRWLGCPAPAVRIREPALPPKQPFSIDELRRILAACRRPQDRAMVLLVLDTGLRRSELTGLRRQDLDLGNGVARIRGKGGKQRVVALGQRSLAALGLCLDGRGYPWRSQRTGGPMTADGFYRLCRRLSQRTGIHVFPHRFRTTWACLFLEATGDVGSAQVLMGHAKVETTLRYAGWIQQRRALEQMRRHSLSDRIAGLGKELP